MVEKQDDLQLRWYAVHVATGFENKMIEEEIIINIIIIT